MTDDKLNNLLTRLDAAWTEFNKSYAGLPEAQLLEPGVTGGWSVKDILAHVTTWEEEALKQLPLIIAGGRVLRYSTVYGSIDAFNEQMTAKKRGLALDEARTQLHDTHRRLIDFIKSTPAEFTGETRARRRLRLDTYSHYPIHTRMIWEWRAQRQLR
jgi:hypothetical protein